MQPLQCTQCMAQVLIQKNSWEHTAVQWTDEAREACLEITHDRTFGRRDGRPGAPRKQCGALAKTIVDAVVAGKVEILDKDPVPGPIIDDSEPIPAPFH